VRFEGRCYCRRIYRALITSQQASFPSVFQLKEDLITSGELVGLSRFELLTPRLSSVCSNQLSYRPELLLLASGSPFGSYSPPARALGFYSPVSPNTDLSKNRRALPLAPSKLDRAFTTNRVEYQIDLSNQSSASRLQAPTSSKELAFPTDDRCLSTGD
jgi:hypothetical protein